MLTMHRHGAGGMEAVSVSHVSGKQHGATHTISGRLRAGALVGVPDEARATEAAAAPQPGAHMPIACGVLALVRSVPHLQG